MNHLTFGLAVLMQLSTPIHPVHVVTHHAVNRPDSGFTAILHHDKPVKPIEPPHLEAPQPLPAVPTPPSTPPAPNPSPAAPASVIQAKVYAAGGDALVNIVAHESSFNPYAVNPSSGSCGLFQRLPCSVMLGDVDGQIANGLAYVNSVYGSPAAAWAFWQTHRWY